MSNVKIVGNKIVNDCKNHRSIIHVTIVVDTCTIHPEYHEERVSSIKEYLNAPIARINRMPNVFAGVRRSDDFITDTSYNTNEGSNLFVL